MKIARAVGIDLGTTNSAVAMLSLRGDEVTLLQDRFRRKTFPSIVGWDPDANTLITAWEAWNRRTLTPTPVSSIKRKMGTQQLSPVGPEELLPQEVSARILTRLADEMRAFLKREADEESETRYIVDRAVITIPAYFDAQQIDATRQAGELADLQVVGLLQEPTAAAMYYAWKHGIGDGTFMVYDLGGGTFDVSIIRCLLGEYQVLGIDGDNFLGGDDFDRKLAEHLRKHLVEQGYALDLDIQNDADDRTRFTLLQRLAQEVKEGLSQSAVQYVARRDLFTDQRGQSVSIEMEVSRDQFEALISELVEETLHSCERALLKSAEAADVTLAEIDHVLLVGGSTRVPLVKRRVSEAFCEGRSRASEPMIDEPDTCVALGAALHAANLAGLSLFAEEGDFEVNLTTPLSTATGELRLAGRLLGAEDQAIDSVVLIDSQGDVEAIVRPEEDDLGLYFSFDELTLPDPGNYPFSLEFCDSDGEPLIAVTLTLARLAYGETLRSTGSALSNPSVLSKDIYLEVVRDGQAARQILLPTGTSLPAQGKFRFYTTDNSGAVILKLFQNRLPIRTIHLTVPEATESGTPVDLNLEIDETMAMVASGEVLGQTFWAQIEPPPEREARHWGDIEALLERVDGVNRELWGYEARHFRERSSLLVAGIHETARTDPDKLQVLVSRLEELMEDYHSRDKELTPNWGRYTELMDAIKRVVWRTDEGPRLGLGVEEWRKRLSSIAQQAEKAYQEHDQNAWSKVFNQVQAIWESLAQDEYRFAKADPQQLVERLHAAAISRHQEVMERISDFSVSANPETAQLQQVKLREMAQELKQRVENPMRQLDTSRLPPAQARQELDRLHEHIDYLERQLEKLPTLGLVRK